VGGGVGGCTYVCWERTEQAEQRKSSGRRPLSPHMQQTAPGGGPPLAPSLPAPGDALPLPMDDGSVQCLPVISDGWTEKPPHAIDPTGSKIACLQQLGSSSAA
jgi:hypothetical protein